MTKLKLLSAALIGAAMLATPAMARENSAASRHLAVETNARAASAERYVDGRACIPAPAVGAFATQPWDKAPPCEPSQGY